jgi:hypothetical protein
MPHRLPGWNRVGGLREAEEHRLKPIVPVRRRRSRDLATSAADFKMEEP